MWASGVFISVYICSCVFIRSSSCSYVLLCAAIYPGPWLGQVWPQLQLTQRPAWAHPREEASATRSSAYLLATICNIWHPFRKHLKTRQDWNERFAHMRQTSLAMSARQHWQRQLVHQRSEVLNRCVLGRSVLSFCKTPLP